uniref:Uncharacterized protein n=1 Tax=Arundo donax TaxID=35708 RepID=A0A0A9CD60_ARUDO
MLLAGVEMYRAHRIENKTLPVESADDQQEAVHLALQSMVHEPPPPPAP